MSAKVDTTTELPPPNVQANALSITRVITTLVILIFASGVVTYTILDFIPVANNLFKSFLSGLIMLLVILPGIYFLHLKPLFGHMKERMKVQAALGTSEKLFKKVLEILPVGVWIIDKDGMVAQVNQAGKELWAGVRYVDIPEYGQYKARWAVTGKEIQPEEWAAARAIQRREASLNEEIIIEAFDGTQKIVLNSAVPIINEENILQGAVVVNQDITTQNKAQQALQESEKLFRTAMEYLPVGVWLTDGTGKIIYGNSAGQKIWEGARYVGIDQFEEYKGWWLKTGKLIEPDDWAVARAINNGETSINEEIEIQCFDGSHKFILNSAIPVRDDHGNILWAFIVNQDITERFVHEREITQAKELMERYFSGISTHIAYMDREFNFIRVNDVYAKASGHPPEYFLGKNHFELYPNEENKAIFQRVVDTGEPFVVYEKSFEYSEFPERGVTYWDWSLQPVKDTNGVVEGLVLSLVDVSIGKRAQIELEQKNKKLEELSKAERRQRELAESLVRALMAINSSLEQEQVLVSILEQIRKIVPFSGANILLLEENKFLRIAGSLGFDGIPKEQLAVGKTFVLVDFPVHTKICETRQPARIDSTKDTPDWNFAPGFEWIRSYLGVPLIFNKDVIGIISLASDHTYAFSQEAEDNLIAFAAPASLALNNALMFKKETTARQAAETVTGATHALTKSLNLEQVVNTLLDHIHMIVYSDTAGVILVEDEIHLAARTSRGYGSLADQDCIPTFFCEGITDALIHRIISARKSLTFTNENLSPDSNENPGSGPVLNWLIVPMISGDKLVGLVELGKAQKDEFTKDNIQWAEVLVGQAATAIQNAWLFQEVNSSSERLQSLTRKLVEVQENERYWIARELHDEAGQALSIMKMHLGRMAQDPDCPEHIRLKLDELKGKADGVLEELHRLAMDLRPVALDHLGLVAALEQFANNLNSERLSVQFKAVGIGEERLPKDLETSLYRIVQEALSNVIRHAQANNVGILLSRDKDSVRLFVEDDGIGFYPNRSEVSTRLGLVGMRERAEMFGGKFTIESYPGEGTSIIVEVPYVH